MDNQPPLPELTLTVTGPDLSFYTTLLQSGIEIKGRDGETLASFLERLPGFDLDYIADDVQTIFLNGTAVDDLATPLTEDTPTVALSAAMPGLAGAIFRRNSFHAGLRTLTDSTRKKDKSNRSPLVTLKLFNSIAAEKGIELLNTGCSIQSGYLLNFLKPRVALVERICRISFENSILTTANLFLILADRKKVRLKIISTNG